jgi:hypothetical protein
LLSLGQNVSLEPPVEISHFLGVRDFPGFLLAQFAANSFARASLLRAPAENHSRERISTLWLLVVDDENMKTGRQCNTHLRGIHVFARECKIISQHANYFQAAHCYLQTAVCPLGFLLCSEFVLGLRQKEAWIFIVL